jgi:hypothetical protein
MTNEAIPLDADDEVFSIGGDAAKGQVSKYDFEGDCAVEITDVKYGKAKSSGNMIYTVTLVGQSGKATGLTFTDYQAEFKTAEMLKHLGIKQGESGNVDFRKSQVLGQQLVAKFKREEYPKDSGKWSAKVQGYAPLSTLPQSIAGDEIPF